MQWQAPRMATLSEQRDAYRAGRPISQDFAFQHACVYAIEFSELKLIKIGVSNNIPQRLRSLQSQAGCKGVVVMTVKGNRRAEAALHSKLRMYRVRGEWFKDCPEVRAVLAATRAPAQAEAA